MKTFYFYFSSGYIGGQGVVKAKNKKEALILANKAISKEPFSKQEKLSSEDCLIEVKSGECVIIANGDY